MESNQMPSDAVATDKSSFIPHHEGRHVAQNAYFQAFRITWRYFGGRRGQSTLLVCQCGHVLTGLTCLSLISRSRSEGNQGDNFQIQ